MDTTDHAQARQQLRAASLLSREECDSRLAQARAPEYWRRLQPGLSVEGRVAAQTLEVSPLGVDVLRAQAARLTRAGYFHTPGIIDPNVITEMRACINTLRQEGWPPVFAFLYDEFWRVVRVPSLVRLVSTYLGEGYLQNANIWTYYVPPVNGARGWPPHTDSTQKRLTVWIPLTDATVENGCIYVVPMDRTPSPPPTLDGDQMEITGATLGHLLQSVRALPANAGSLLGWNHQVIHWGSMSSESAAEPRISIAVEFVQRAEGDTNHRLIEITEIPPLDRRLKIVGRALLKYCRFEPRFYRYSELATRLVESKGRQ